MSKGIVLVSGATGYIGSHVVKEFLDNGYTVRGTVRKINSEKNSHLQEWINAGEPLELVEADLLNPGSWISACQGCDYVAHVASPFFMDCKESEAEEKMYKPARDGTKNVLNAAKMAGVKRVILTSSIIAITEGHTKKELEEENPERIWTNLNSNKINPYGKSKTYAEKAAWEFVENNKEENHMFDLVTICPSFVVGPPLSKNSATSNDVVRKILMRETAGIANVNFNITDVRDVARSHRLALEVKEAAGNRFLCETGTIGFQKWCKIYQKEFSTFGYKPPTMVVPYPVLVVLGMFDTEAKAILPMVNQPPINYDTSKIKKVLGLEMHDIEKSLIEHAHACLRVGTPGFKKTERYQENFPTVA